MLGALARKLSRRSADKDPGAELKDELRRGSIIPGGPPAPKE